MKIIISKNVHDLEATKKIAKEITKILNNSKNFSVFLEGGLGAGKTFLVREILNNLGEKKAIPSPTYTYVNQYKTNNKNYAHFDFYRLDSPNSFFEKGLEEISSDENISCFSEWVNKISRNAQKTFSGKKFCIKIEFGVGVGMRKIKFFSI